jgi:hypothetical protein
MRRCSSDIHSSPISDVVRHACYRCELGASARHKAANLGVAVAVVIGPHNGGAETVGFGYNCRVRQHNPFSVNADTIVAILCVPIDILHLTPSAKAQHNPFLLARRSNHSLSGEFAKRPSSRAYKRLGTNIASHTIMTAKLMSLYIVVTTAPKAAVCALAHKFKCRFERVATHDRVATKLT